MLSGCRESSSLEAVECLAVAVRIQKLLNFLAARAAFLRLGGKLVQHGAQPVGGEGLLEVGD